MKRFLDTNSAIPLSHPHSPNLSFPLITHLHPHTHTLMYLESVKFLLLSRVSFEIREFPYFLCARYLIITRMIVFACETPRAKISGACWNAITQDKKFFFLFSLFFLCMPNVRDKGTKINPNETPVMSTSFRIFLR